MKQKPAGSPVVDPVPPQLVKSLTVEVLVGDAWVPVRSETDITKRLQNLTFESTTTRALRIRFRETYGHPNARLFEVRCY